MKLTKKQKEGVFYLRHPEVRELVYGGAAGGGKSALGVLWLMEQCLKYPGSRWLMGRSKLKTLRETTLNTFFELAGKLGLSGGNNPQFHYNSQDYVIYFKNGSQIILKDLFNYPSDPEFDSLGSLEICGAFIDECNQIVYKAWQVVMSRCRYKLKEFGIKPMIFGSCNPSKNWVYKQFYNPSRNGNLKQGRAFIQALPTDNPFLPPEYLQALLSLEKNSRERLYYGNWDYDDDPAQLISFDAIIDYFNPIALEEEKRERDKRNEDLIKRRREDECVYPDKYITIDVARKGKDSTVFRVWENWLVVDRVSLPISTIPDTVREAKKLMAKYGVSLSCVIADEDGVGGGVVDVLGCKGFVNNGRPIKEFVGDEYLVPNYQNLRSQCGVKMAEKIEKREVGEPNLTADIQDRIQEEMGQIKQKDIDKDGKVAIIGKEKIIEMIGRSPDDWDSIMMRYWFELKPKVFTF